MEFLAPDVDLEIWVNPSGHTIRRQVSTHSQKAEPPSIRDIEPPQSDLRKKLKEIKGQLWPAMADFQGKVESLELNPASEVIKSETSKSRNKVRGLITELSDLNGEAKGVDDSVADEAAEEWMNAMEVYSPILQRYNQIE